MTNTNTNTNTDMKVWIVDATEESGGEYGSSISYSMGAYWTEKEARAEASRLTADEQWSKYPQGISYAVHSMTVGGERPF